MSLVIPTNVKNGIVFEGYMSIMQMPNVYDDEEVPEQHF